jgi:hypothetical protein
MADQNQGASIEAERLIDAVRKLVKAKGRFHTEQNYKALVDSLDAYDAAVKAPPTAAAGAEGLPPLPSDEELRKLWREAAKAGTAAWGKADCETTRHGWMMRKVYEAVAREAIAHYLQQRGAAEELAPLPTARAIMDVVDEFGSGSECYTVDDVEQIRRDIIGFYERGAERIARKQEEILRQAQDLQRTVAGLLAQRKQAALQEIIDIGQEIEAGAAPSDAGLAEAGALRQYQWAHNNGAVTTVSAYDKAIVDREFARLRAQLASAQQAKEYEQRHAVESEAALAQVQTQLAAKGQGFEQWWADQIKENGGTPIGADYRHWAEKGYLAAPASAQPAEKVRCKFDGNGCGSVGPYCDKCDLPGAQPDQRESAAEADEAKAVLERAADMLEGYAKYCYRVKPDEIEEHPYIPSIEEAAEELRALAASPVAQPVAKEGEQPTNNKGEN